MAQFELKEINGKHVIWDTVANTKAAGTKEYDPFDRRAANMKMRSLNDRAKKGIRGR